MDSKYFTASSRGMSWRETGSSFFASSAIFCSMAIEILGRERPLVRKIVVETVLDDRTDRHLRIGKQLLDRIREQMGGRVTQQVEAVGVAVGDDGEVRIAVDRERGIDELAVDLAGERGFGESGADRGGDLGDGDRRVEVFDGAVG